MKTIVLVLAAVVLAVESFLLYGFYQDNYGSTIAPGDSPATTPGSETTMNEATVPEAAERGPKDRVSINAPEGVSFIHRARPGNTSENSTFINDPRINDNPDAILIVTRVYRSDDEKEVHETGVWYYARGGKWAIFNQDLAPMSEDAAFNVIALEGAGTIVHRATSANTTADATYLDDPLTNNAPGAVLSVTQNWNPDGGVGTYNDHPVAVRYKAGRGRWAIFNRDSATMPENAAFNVAVSSRR